MVNTSRYKILFLLLGLLANIQFTYAQPADAFATITVSPRNGVVRQPFKVTVSANSSTWFAKPLDFDNFRMDNAFIIPFTRTVSSISYINNKKYATLSFFFLVFPYEEGELYIPEITITTSIPPKGDYKGVPRTLKTKRQRIVVNKIPKEKGQKVELVAQSASIKERWNKSLNTLKVGDVIERVITIDASGTLPSFIPPLNIGHTENISIYGNTAVLKDTRDDLNVNGKRIETYSYLFEKEGEVTIPSEEITWWNPNTKKVYKRIIAERKITIAPNPDLAMLNSLRDSLNAINEPVITEPEQDKYPWKRALMCVTLGLLALIIAFTITKREVTKAIKKRKQYLKSEKYAYKHLENAIRKGNIQTTFKYLYHWIDRARVNSQSPSISSYLDTAETKFFNELSGRLTDGLCELSYEEKRNLKIMVSRLRKSILDPKKESSSNKVNP